MLSRTSARQQRMRQQTLNEERMAQTQESSRPPGERRSSGSKLIISSPTPTAYPLINHTQPASQTTTFAEGSVRTTQANRTPTASALLAFLSGGDQRQVANSSATNPSPGVYPQSGFNSNLGSTGTPISLNLAPLKTQQPQQQQNFAKLTRSTETPGSTSEATASTGDNNRNLMYAITAGSGNANSLTKPRIQISPQTQATQRTGVVSSSKLPAAPTKTTAVNPVSHVVEAAPVNDANAVEMESTVSPASSDMNSPMESCFANIMEEQGSDSFDLNNITPSIQLSSSVGVVNDLVNYPRQGPSASSCGRSHLTGVAQPQPGIRIGQVNNLSTHLGRDLSKIGDDDSPIKASTSCPAGMQDTLHQLGTSPLAFREAQVGASGSGGSLGDGGSGSTSGTAMLIAGPRGSDDQRVAWMRDRTKKDSHNRIERKRRDYINCQITELGNLLPEEMFRDGDCKKNKGSILKNSVEFICLLRSELVQVPEVRKETNLAAKVIGQLIKRIQELEALTNQNQAHLNVGSVEYERSLQEWLVLHERNLQNKPVSPMFKPAFHHISDATGSTSPGLSSTGTEDILVTDSKSVFSSPTGMVGSAPAPSAPLANCSRLNSPVPCNALVSRHSAGMTDSPMRMVRTRCTSLTVAGSGINSHLEFGTPGLLLSTSTDNPHTVLHHQRLASGQHSASQMRTTLQPNQQHQLPQTISQSQPRSSLLQSQGRHWPQQSQTLHLQDHLSPHHTFTQQPRIQISMPIGVSTAGGDHDMSTCLSASLPVNVNPLRCGPQDHDECKLGDSGLVPVYSFERDEFVPQLKTEPPSDETETRTGELSYPDPGPSNVEIGYAPTGSGSFDPLIASAGVQHHSDSRPPTATGVGEGAATTRGRNFVTNMTLDSPSAAGFESDDFRFDDVPME
ncbi:unnamed protein product [Calicophoron daubneyi]|uniref:BHLH domain-containing protein n=1 Tax=Calicophoron daubneyi TaxID=300641 RepID=A0AAV2T8L9_CALDB